MPAASKVCIFAVYMNAFWKRLAISKYFTSSTEKSFAYVFEAYSYTPRNITELKYKKVSFYSFSVALFLRIRQVSNGLRFLMHVAGTCKD